MGVVKPYSNWRREASACARRPAYCIHAVPNADAPLCHSARPNSASSRVVHVLNLLQQRLVLCRAHPFHCRRLVATLLCELRWLLRHQRALLLGCLAACEAWMSDSAHQKTRIAFSPNSKPTPVAREDTERRESQSSVSWSLARQIKREATHLTFTCLLVTGVYSSSPS